MPSEVHYNNGSYVGKEVEEVDKKTKTDSAAEISSMEDLLMAAGTKGWRNYLIFFFCAWASVVSPLHTLSYQFLGATPEYWCHIPQLESANWTVDQIVNFTVPNLNPEERLESCHMINMDYTEAAKMTFEEAIEEKQNLIFDESAPLKCDRRTFDPEEPETVVTKWDLVCDRRVLYSTTQATIQAGKLIGSALMGYLANLFGRKRTLVVSIPLYLIVGIVTAWSPNVGLYIALKFLISTIAVGFYLPGIVLSFEMCSKSQRSFIGAMFAIPWAIGYMVLPGIAYLVRPFFQLQIAVTLPILTVFPCFWILMESPRWLVLQGRFEEAIQVLQTLASHNRRTLPSKQAMLIYMERLYEESNRGAKNSNALIISLRKFFQLIVDKTWIWKVLILFFIWFSVSMVYYGVSLNPPNLSQDKYMYIFLGGVLEVPSYLLLWPANKYIGRRISLILLFLVCALAIFAASGLSFQESSSEGPSSTHSWLLFLSLVGKFAITAAFQLVWIYTTELIPTEQRSEFVGASSALARCGSIASPYIVDLLGEVTKWAPSAIFGSFSLVSAVLIFFLPETKNLNLAEFI